MPAIKRVTAELSDAPTQIEGILASLASHFLITLKTTPEVVAVYVYGSAVTGRFVHGASDIDLLFVLDERVKSRVDTLVSLRRTLEQSPYRSILDVNVAFADEVRHSVPYRPFIYYEISRYGRLLYGQPAIKRTSRPNRRHVLEAIAFDTREYRRVFFGKADDGWEPILTDNLRLHFRRLLLCVGEYEPNLTEAVRRFVQRYPDLAPDLPTFLVACSTERVSDMNAKRTACIRTLERLRAFLRSHMGSAAAHIP